MGFGLYILFSQQSVMSSFSHIGVFGYLMLFLSLSLNYFLPG